ncbi:MAG: formate/nitrite transporter family protein [Eubacteriales bacterium]|nr:formate/nitrite transporter family protein [Eubacteriales bacterium]
MNMFTSVQTVENYAEASIKKSKLSFWRMAALAVLAGMMIAFAGAATNTATYAMTDGGMIRLVCGLIFPFGLVMVILSGAELFTGNCLMSIGVLNGRITAGGMLRNLVVVYIGNFIGSIIVAVVLAKFGQFEISGGALAVSTIKTALAKCSMPFFNTMFQGILCNVLVCLAVLFSLSAKDVTGRFIGAYVPVALFVILGVNHCIADMYYVSAGLFAVTDAAYSTLAAEAGIDIMRLTWGNYLLNNLLPVTIGNIIGGLGIGNVMWFCNLKKGRFRGQTLMTSKKQMLRNKIETEIDDIVENKAQCD